MERTGHPSTLVSQPANTGLSSPLLSRFDVVLVLVDSADEAWDRRVAARIAAAHGCPALEQALEHTARGGGDATPAPAVEDEDDEAEVLGFTAGPPSDPAAPPASPDAPWHLPGVKAFVLHARSVATPLLSPEAERLLSAYYSHRRRIDAGSGLGGGLGGAFDAADFYGGVGDAGGRGTGEASRVTVRTLESLVRLTQAHAKLRLAAEATLTDAVEAIRLVDVASPHPLVANAAPPREPFPADPDAEHAVYRAAVLRKL